MKTFTTIAIAVNVLVLLSALALIFFSDTVLVSTSMSVVVLIQAFSTWEMVQFRASL